MPGGGAWTMRSNERVKYISSTYEKCLTEIMQLEPIKFHYKNVGKRRFDDRVLAIENVGFSAQEVQNVFPETAGTGDDGYLNFNMHAILVAQVNAINELNNTQNLIIEKLIADNKKQKKVRKSNLEKLKDLRLW